MGAVRDKIIMVRLSLRAIPGTWGAWARLMGCLILAQFPAGCVRFHSQPLLPAETAQQLEQRSLSSPELEKFLEHNLHHPFTNWPAQPWDIEMLTLTAFRWNPSLEAVRADWRVAAAGVDTAHERPNPTTTASLLHEPVPGAPAPWIPTVLFDVPLETAGKRRWRTQQAVHLSDSARLNLATAAWQVRSSVRSNLLEYVVARQRVALQQRQLALQQEYVGRLVSQLEAGAISRVEVTTARLALARTRADLADAQRVLAEARPQLAESLGVSDLALGGVEVEFDLAQLAGADLLTAPEARQRALLGRTDILAGLADYAASQSALQLAIAQQYPDVHLAPGYSWNAGSAGEHDWQIGLTVELPIFNRHRGPIAEAAARRQASAARFLALQARVIADVDTAVASFGASRTNAAALDTLLGEEEQQVRAASQQLQAGAADRLAVLTAELELNTTQLLRLEAQLRLQLALGALEDALQRPFDLPSLVFESAKP
jgi:cobalt-zinc-cadmium efflux system outer membrane protein